jgi:hypothetical protein
MIYHRSSLSYTRVTGSVTIQKLRVAPCYSYGELLALLVYLTVNKKSVWFKDFFDFNYFNDESGSNEDDDGDDHDDNDDNIDANNHDNDSMESGGLPDLPLELLQKSRVLETLVVGKYYRYGGGAIGKLFFDALAHNVTLRTLDLTDENDFCQKDSWIKHFAAALMVNESLESINLTRNSLNDMRLKWVCAALKVNTILREMDLTQNCIGNLESEWLGDALIGNTTLFKIVLCNNRIGDQGAECLAVAVKFNSTLR